MQNQHPTRDADGLQDRMICANGAQSASVKGSENATGCANDASRKSSHLDTEAAPEPSQPNDPLVPNGKRNADSSTAHTEGTAGELNDSQEADQQKDADLERKPEAVRSSTRRRTSRKSPTDESGNDTEASR